MFRSTSTSTSTSTSKSTSTSTSKSTSTSTSKSNLEIFNDKFKLDKDDMKCGNLEYYFNINTKNNLIDNLKSDNSNFDISKLNNFSNLITIVTNNI